MKKWIHLFLIAVTFACLISCDDDPGCDEKLWFEDKDGDGYGWLLAEILVACDQPEGYVDNADDGDDDRADVIFNQDKARVLLRSYEGSDASIVNKYISGETFKQHNLMMANGRDPIVNAVNLGAWTGTEVEIQRIFTDDDIVVVHSRYAGPIYGSAAVFNVFRFQNSVIIEHWDNAMPIEDDGDGNTQFDGASSISDTLLSESNKTFVNDFVREVFVNGRWSSYTNYVDDGKFVSHSVGAPAGTGFFQNMQDGTKLYSSIKFVFGEGNFVLTMSQGEEDPGTGKINAHYDLFRLESSRIVEHWDVVQEIPPMDQWANANGKW